MQPGVTKHHKGSIFSPFLQIPDELEKKGREKSATGQTQPKKYYLCSIAFYKWYKLLTKF